MAENLRTGDKARWNSHGFAEATGEGEESGGEAMHKPNALKKDTS